MAAPGAEKQGSPLLRALRAVWLDYILRAPLFSLLLSVLFPCSFSPADKKGMSAPESTHIQSHSPCPYSLQYSSECVPGCVCPNGLVADGNGGCVVAEDCPCVHNEATYRPGETIQVGCNNWYVGVTVGEVDIQAITRYRGPC